MGFPNSFCRGRRHPFDVKARYVFLRFRVGVEVNTESSEHKQYTQLYSSADCAESVGL